MVALLEDTVAFMRSIIQPQSDLCPPRIPSLSITPESLPSPPSKPVPPDADIFSSAALGDLTEVLLGLSRRLDSGESDRAPVIRAAAE